MAGVYYEIEDESYYLFTCAELKSREKEFVPRSRVERMISAAGMEEFLKVLGETFYAPKLDSLKKDKSFEQVMISGYRDMVDYVDERLRDKHKKIIYILFFEEFLHNAKLIFKSVLTGKSLRELYIPLKYEQDILIEAYESRKYEEIENPFPEIINHIRDLVDEPGDKEARKMELGLEAFYTARLLETAESLDRRMMVDYVRHKIDLINIETLYRNKQVKDKTSFKEFLHKGGSLKLKMLGGLESESMDYMVKELGKTEYANVVIKGAQRLFSNCSFSSFERNKDLYFLNFFDLIKYSTSNLEKIFQFLLRKKIELINLNILYTGIRFKADKENMSCKVG